MTREEVILVDENDVEIGTAEKLQAHQEGLLHRAFSIFVFNSQGKLLLQKRASSKYHSAGLWTNTCCSHPRPGQDLLSEAHRKLKLEMGFQCDLRHLMHFKYQTRFENQLIENEFDHVFIGRFDGEPRPSPEEVEDWKWIDPKTLQRDLSENPQAYSYWFRICLDSVINSVIAP